MTQRPIYKHIPFILLILVQLTFGLLSFRDYGLSWDEPLFYDYGEAPCKGLRLKSPSPPNS